MNVFISWSGDTSLAVANVLRDWIPCVIQGLVPYVSSKDIDKGARWGLEIAKELEQSSFGILCITKDNLNSSWLNFEAGALSKTMDKSKVCPLLFGLKPSEISSGPILQFQMTSISQDDIFALFSSLNKCLDDKKLSEEMLKKMYEMCWPKMKMAFDSIIAVSPSKGNSSISKKNEQEILEEILNLVRNQQVMLRSPDVILPPDYLQSIIQQGKMDIRYDIEKRLGKNFIYEYREINNTLQYFINHDNQPVELVPLISQLINMNRELFQVLGLQMRTSRIRQYDSNQVRAQLELKDSIKQVSSSDKTILENY